jgi:hydroxymethylpyrimidine/phosphomethylpyrimidine kinase
MLEEADDAWVEAGRALLQTGARSIVIKGGHLAGAPRDLLVTPDAHDWYDSMRIESPHTHGTGCTFSSAIAANLALGHSIAESVRRAKAYITGAIAAARVFGLGINPVNHFWRENPRFGDLR